ncbi:hypothetical protein [Micromonospora halophytica]|nr:hypothetical protein [Micromonospora halophytica]
MADGVFDLLDIPAREIPFAWDAAESVIGARLPLDYKELIDRTGAVIVDGWLCLFGPAGESNESNIALVIDERERAWVKFRQSGIELPIRYFVEGSRLLAFAAVEANYFFWRARDGVAPEEWGVVIADADLEGWYDFDLSATECIYQVLVGDIDLDPFEDLFGGTEHRAEPFLG